MANDDLICTIITFCYFFFLQDSEQYVEKLLELFNRFSKLVKEAFSDDPRFLTARDKVSELGLKIHMKFHCFDAIFASLCLSQINELELTCLK